MKPGPCARCGGVGFLVSPMRACGVCASTGKNRAARARDAKEWAAWARAERKRERRQARILRGEIDGDDT